MPEFPKHPLLFSLSGSPTLEPGSLYYPLCLVSSFPSLVPRPLVGNARTSRWAFPLVGWKEQVGTLWNRTATSGLMGGLGERPWRWGGISCRQYAPVVPVLLGSGPTAAPSFGTCPEQGAVACKSGESGHHYDTWVPATLPKNCPELAYRCLKRRWCKRCVPKVYRHPKVNLDLGADKKADVGSMNPGGSSSIPLSYFGPIVGHPGP